MSYVTELNLLFSGPFFSVDFVLVLACDPSRHPTPATTPLTVDFLRSFYFNCKVLGDWSSDR